MACFYFVKHTTHTHNKHTHEPGKTSQQEETQQKKKKAEILL